MRERAAATAAALTLAAALLIGFKAPDTKALVTSIKPGSGGSTTGTGTTNGGSTGTTNGYDHRHVDDRRIYDRRIHERRIHDRWHVERQQPERIRDLHGAGRGQPVRRRPGPDHGEERQDHRRAGALHADRRALRTNLELRRADPSLAGPQRPVREHQRGVGRLVHQPGVCAIPPGSAGRGGDLTHPASAPGPIAGDAIVDPERIVHVEPVMGTVVSFDIRRPFASPEVIRASCDVLHDIDRRFSLYRSDSELGRLAAGEIAESDLSADVRWVLGACDELARTSDGAFDARHHRPDGVVDPSGFVKGWAVEEAVRHLDADGATNYLVGAGGDLVARGAPAPGESWRIGIRHPEITDKVAAVIALNRGAIATSGLYERGDHILDPRHGQPPRSLLSFTVIGPDLAWADAYATAGFVMGLDGLGWVEAHPGYGAMAITADQRVVWAPVADARRVDPA